MGALGKPIKSVLTVIAVAPVCAFITAFFLPFLSSCSDRIPYSAVKDIGLTGAVWDPSNNTSAALSFTDRYHNYITGAISTNGNALPSSTSNIDTHSLLPNHPQTKIYAETQGWYCHNGSNVGSNGLLIDDARCGNNLDIGYDSVQTAALQVTDMISRGFDGAAMNWYLVNGQADKALQAMRAYVLANNLNFKLSVVIDKGAFQYGQSGPCASVINQTQLAICFIDYALNTYSDVMIRTQDGRYAIYWFITGYNVGTVDWTAVHSHAASRNAALINNDIGGFSAMNGLSDGAYGWVNTSTDSVGYIDILFNTSANFSSDVVVGGAWRAFDDVIASWTLNRIVDGQCGQMWLDTFARNDIKPNLTSLMISTWDDYTEGTEIQTGIDNCITSISGTLNGATLSWKVNFGSSPSGFRGTDKTIAYYLVFVSRDGGVSFQAIARVSPNGSGTGTAVVNGAPGSAYYIEAVGQPSIHNFFSSAIP